jgi:AcrR family transcriptional regulator
MKAQEGRRRAYRMDRRARAVEETGRRILDAAFAAFGEDLYDQVSLQHVAARAGVTVQTVIRRFGSKDELYAALARWRSEQIRTARDATPVGDSPLPSPTSPSATSGGAPTSCTCSRRNAAVPPARRQPAGGAPFECLADRDVGLVADRTDPDLLRRYLDENLRICSRSAI